MLLSGLICDRGAHVCVAVILWPRCHVAVPAVAVAPARLKPAAAWSSCVSSAASVEAAVRR